MGALISLPITILNFFLPFTKPGTPLLQDFIHTIVLCSTLYFAPQILEQYRTQSLAEPLRHTPEHDERAINDTYQESEQLPLDDRLVLQDDDEGEGEGEENDLAPRPPLAPSPPPQHNRHAPPPRPHVEDAPALHDNQPFPAGPANDLPRPTPANRGIGTKKANTLARKDQRRAYHEFHRQEAELRRLQEREGAEEREAALTAERERRVAVENEIREKERIEREKRKEEERREAEEESERRERVVTQCRDELSLKGAVNLTDVAWSEGKDRLWVERLARASGVVNLARSGGKYVMITGHGWLVSVDEQLMKRVYKDAETHGARNGGRVSMEDFEKIMEKAVLERAEGP